jgi:hypothetical protein
MQTKYRETGAIGALLDEYERSISDLKSLLLTASDQELADIVDAETKDEDCRSIQTIMAHVVRSGYGYAIIVRKHAGENLEYLDRKYLKNGADFCKALNDMFAYNVQLFEDYPNLKIEEYDNAKKILVSWGQSYDVEQLFEHAIVHILRHRRQIERFLLKLR